MRLKQLTQRQVLSGTGEPFLHRASRGRKSLGSRPYDGVLRNVALCTSCPLTGTKYTFDRFFRTHRHSCCDDLYSKSRSFDDVSLEQRLLTRLVVMSVQVALHLSHLWTDDDFWHRCEFLGHAACVVCCLFNVFMSMHLKIRLDFRSLNFGNNSIFFAAPPNWMDLGRGDQLFFL